MKSLSLMLSLVLMSPSAVAFTQSGAQKASVAVAPSGAQKSEAQKSDVQKSDAQKSFDQLKTLAGSWEGHLTTVPQTAEVNGKLAQVSLRVTSRGNALVHELSVDGIPDHPVTMFYLDGDRLTLVHYCDAGNRPRMVGKVSPDGKTVEFEFLDLSGGNQKGHMDHAVFTFLDANHHIEDWTYMMPGDKPVRAHFDLQRTGGGAASGK